MTMLCNGINLNLTTRKQKLSTPYQERWEWYTEGQKRAVISVKLFDCIGKQLDDALANADHNEVNYDHM